MGGAAMVIGVLVVVFNRQLFSAMEPLMRKVPPWRNLFDHWSMYQAGPSGRVPVLTIIGTGWVLIGGLFVFVAVTNQPL